MSVEDRIRDIVVPIVEDLDLVLFDLDYSGGRVRVTIDQDDGVDSELLTLATRQISREFDEVDPIASAYTLEVTTPGIERKLRRPQHYQRSLNYQVAVKLIDELDGDRRVTGTITAADDDGFTVRRDDGSDLTIDYDQVQKARTTFEWGPQPKPGGPKNSTSKNKNAKNSNPKTNGSNKNAAKKSQSSTPATTEAEQRPKQDNKQEKPGPTDKAGVS